MMLLLVIVLAMLLLVQLALALVVQWLVWTLPTCLRAVCPATRPSEADASV